MTEERKGKGGLTHIGKVNYRRDQRTFGIKGTDRLGHIYILGKTGVGKSTLLQNMLISDILKGRGAALIDPHGDLALDLLNYIPQEGIKDVVYFHPGELSYSIGFNPLGHVPPDKHHAVASGLVGTFKKLWPDSWGPRLEHIFRNTLLTLLWYPGATLLDIQPLLTNPLFKQRVLQHVKDERLHLFWQNEYDRFSPPMRAEAISPILNKIGLLQSSIPLRNCIGQKKNSLNIRQIMDEGQIFIANLSKGALGEDTSAFFGSMLVTAFQLAALSRVDSPLASRTPFYLYIDEVHAFITESFTGILSEARKYGLALTLAHQYIEQLPESLRSAIFGNVGTLICFRVGAADAEYLAREFYPVFDEEDLVNLPKHHIYLKLMIDGATSPPFSAITLPLPEERQHHAQAVMEYSKSRYGKPREVVEHMLRLATPQEKKERTLFS